MKLKTMVAFAIAGTALWGKAMSPTNSAPDLTVCLEESWDFALVYPLEAEASKIFEQAEVHLAWSNGRVCKHVEAIRIRLSEQTPKALLPGALAYAQPREGHAIELFYDRIRTAVPASQLQHLLAHVLVHEITHILEGVARHSETGIMRAHWTPFDYREMSRHPLAFDPEDVRLIQESLKARRERI